MKKRLYKALSVLLILSFLATPVTPIAGGEGAVALDEVLGYETPKPTNFNPDDVFDVYVEAGFSYDGYTFVLREDAVYCFEYNDVIEDVWASINMFWAQNLEDIARNINEKSILYIEPNYLFEIESVPEPVAVEPPPLFQPFAFQPTNDPYFSQQWNLEGTRGAAAWTAGLTGQGVTVAVMDTGIYRRHADFNFSRVLPTVYLPGHAAHHHGDCFSGHGTSVTGMIAAARNNGRGIASIAPNVTILPMAVTQDYFLLPSNSLVEAVRIATENFNVDVINASIGLPIGTAQLRDAFNAARARGIISIASAGNHNGTALRFPAGFDSVIGVGATNRSEERGTWPAGGSAFNHSVSFVAPGVDVPTLGFPSTADFPWGIPPNCPRGYVMLQTGTSFAAPYVAAMAALARQHNPNITPAQFYDILRRSSIGRGTPGWNRYYGHGLVDVGLFVHRLTEQDFFNYTDVPQNFWARAHITFASRYGLMHGEAQRTFAPNRNITRAEYVAMLGNMHRMTREVVPHVTSSPFTDVPNSHFAVRHIEWARTNNIVGGIGNNMFGTNDPAPRQQAAVMLLNYARFRGVNIGTINRNVLNQFSDRNQIADWALDGMAWAVQHGLMSGTPQGRIEPTRAMTRAEAAAMAHQYTQRFAPIAVVNNTAAALFNEAMIATYEYRRAS